MKRNSTARSADRMQQAKPFEEMDVACLEVTFLGLLSQTGMRFKPHAAAI